LGCEGDRIRVCRKSIYVTWSWFRTWMRCGHTESTLQRFLTEIQMYFDKLRALISDLDLKIC